MQQRRTQLAYDHIRRKLATGLLSSGAAVSPQALSKEIGVSPIPVREALSQLQSEGWLVPHRRRGLFVRTVDRQELVEAYEVRTTLECAAVAKAARRISRRELNELKSHLAELRAIAESFRTDPDSDVERRLARWMLTDLAFHMVLLRAAANQMYIKVIDDLRLMSQMFGFRTDPPSAWTDPARYFAENYAVHDAVFTAVARGDSKAARKAMSAHMKLARRTMLARFDHFQSQASTAQQLAQEFPESVRQQVREIEKGVRQSSRKRTDRTQKKP